MTDDANLEHPPHVVDAWRSGGAHDLARILVLAARFEGANRQIQEAGS